MFEVRRLGNADVPNILQAIGKVREDPESIGLKGPIGGLAQQTANEVNGLSERPNANVVWGVFNNGEPAAICTAVEDLNGAWKIGVILRLQAHDPDTAEEFRLAIRRAGQQSIACLFNERNALHVIAEQVSPGGISVLASPQLERIELGEAQYAVRRYIRRNTFIFERHRA